MHVKSVCFRQLKGTPCTHDQDGTTSASEKGKTLFEKRKEKKERKEIGHKNQHHISPALISKYRHRHRHRPKKTPYRSTSNQWFKLNFLKLRKYISLFLFSLCTKSIPENVSVTVHLRSSLKNERRSNGFGTTWGRVINDRICIFEWTISLKGSGIQFYHVCLFSLWTI